MSQKALFINSIQIKTKFIKSFEKVMLRAEKFEKSEILMIFELQTVPIFRLGDENFLKKSRSHVSESTFYQF